MQNDQNISGRQCGGSSSQWCACPLISLTKNNGHLITNGTSGETEREGAPSVQRGRKITIIPRHVVSCDKFCHLKPNPLEPPCWKCSALIIKIWSLDKKKNLGWALRDRNEAKMMIMYVRLAGDGTARWHPLFFSNGNRPPYYHLLSSLWRFKDWWRSPTWQRNYAVSLLPSVDPKSNISESSPLLAYLHLYVSKWLTPASTKPCFYISTTCHMYSLTYSMCRYILKFRTF